MEKSAACTGHKIDIGDIYIVKLLVRSTGLGLFPFYIPMTLCGILSFVSKLTLKRSEGVCVKYLQTSPPQVLYL